MKERPIIFSGSMIQAILANQKTQTRRVIKPQPIYIEWFEHQHGWCAKTGNSEYAMLKCPYGQPGDRLWVRETWRTRGNALSELDGRSWAYKADDNEENKRNLLAWKSPIYMPRWASRLTLEITKIRVERVQDISCQDAVAEGCPMPTQRYGMHPWPQVQFQKLWDSINAKRGFGWDKNPWVWVIKFRMIPEKGNKSSPGAPTGQPERG